MPRKLVPLKYFIFIDVVLRLLHNILLIQLIFYNLQIFLMSPLSRAPSSKDPVKFQ